jgi:ubiquinone/menaquinone biosynthesis C-methylase UbiE
MYLIYSGFFDHVRRLYFRKILEHCPLPEKSKILDYGCGPGDFLSVANSRGVEAVGVDSARRSVEIARERGLNVVLGDSSTLNYPPESFNMIIMHSVIEHIDNPLQTLGQLANFLKTGGVFVVSAPTPGNYFWDDPTHVRPYTPKALRTIGELLGLKVEKISFIITFLIGFSFTSSFLYKLLNIFPFSLGSNVVVFYRKQNRCCGV